MPVAGVDVVINLRAEGVSVLLDLTDGRLPAIVHWGGDLGALDLVAAEALMLSGVRPRPTTSRTNRSGWPCSPSTGPGGPAAPA